MSVDTRIDGAAVGAVETAAAFAALTPPVVVTAAGRAPSSTSVRSPGAPLGTTTPLPAVPTAGAVPPFSLALSTHALPTPKRPRMSTPGSCSSNDASPLGRWADRRIVDAVPRRDIGNSGCCGVTAADSDGPRGDAKPRESSTTRRDVGYCRSREAAWDGRAVPVPAPAPGNATPCRTGVNMSEVAMVSTEASSSSGCGSGIESRCAVTNRSSGHTTPPRDMHT